MKLFGTHLIAASIMAGMAVPAAATTTTETTREWLSQCAASEVVTRRINELTADEVGKASELLSRAGLFEGFSQLTTDEGCLTLAATAASSAPAIVLNFERQSGYGRKVEQALANSMQERLEQLDIGYTIPTPDVDAGSPMLELYQARPKEAKKAYWQIFTSNLKADSRSISGVFGGHCVILHDTSAFGDFVRRRLRSPLDNHFTSDDRSWLDDHGEAMEFWHEVSHCEQSPVKTADGPHGAGGSGDSDNSPNPDSAAQTNEDDGDPMDIMRSGGTLDVGQCPTAQSALAASGPGKWSPQSMTPENRDDISMGYLSGLSGEVEADLFARQAVAHRFNTGQPGCRDFRDIENLNPWEKFRLSMSMLYPEFQYMTWLNPWLHNLNTMDQMQVALEAWEANMTVAFDDLEIPHQAPLVRRFAQRQAEGGVWNIAGHEADQDRVQAWADWLVNPFRSQKYTQ